MPAVCVMSPCSKMFLTVLFCIAVMYVVHTGAEQRGYMYVEYVNKDCMGNNINNGKAWVGSTVKECEEDCDNTPTCVGFVFDNTYDDCWLKHTCLPVEFVDKNADYSFVRTDIDECANDALNNCDSDADCENSEGSFTCSCKAGYTGDGLTCAGILVNKCPDPNSRRMKRVAADDVRTATLLSSGQAENKKQCAVQCMRYGPSCRHIRYATDTGHCHLFTDGQDMFDHLDGSERLSCDHAFIP